MLLTRLGKYRIISWLGGGAFGDVYLAEDTLLGKSFALKVSRLREKEIRFLKSEAQILASLDHPNIARFYNLDIIDGKLVLVMEYVEGESLRDVLEKRRIEIKEVPDFFFPVLDALNYAHSKGVLHRDVKPENILISHEGCVKLVDFGLGVFLKGGSLKATLAGTPIYMPPESWEGVFLPSSDLYSLAVVIYEALTGRNPFEGDTLEDIRRKVFDLELKPLSFYLPSIPSDLDGVLAKALSKRVEDRYNNAWQFKEDLAKALRLGRSLELPHVVLSRPSEELSLTPAQREVVFSPERRILLIGGAGTGKTTTLLYRLYRKLREGEDPSSFLVLSFTKKAVSDMKERLSLLLGKELRDIWIETFHGALYKILKREGERFGFSQNFLLISSSLPILKELANDLSPPQIERVLSEIAILRARLISPSEFMRFSRSPWERKVAKLYNDFSERKLKMDVMDFDDLLFYGVKLLEDEDAREVYSKRFRFLFVDELQDLNEAQYRFIKLLSSQDSEIFLTGDKDQSIYRWRGALPDVLDRAERELSLKRYELTHSFRLPKSILRVATSLMSRAGRDMSNMVSMRGEGKVELYIASDEIDEARFVTHRVRELSSSKKLSSMAVLYRHNYQSRVIEDQLIRLSIPYQVLGASRFYEREEVKRVISYLKGLVDRDLKPVTEFFSWLLGWKKSRFVISERIELENGRFSNRKKAERLIEFLDGLIKGESFTVEELLRIPLDISGAFKRRGGEWNAFKEGFLELLKLASSFGKGEMREFLNYLSLMEEMGLTYKGDLLNLLTFHSAKGLEFDVVFITGLFDGNVPALRSLARVEEVEEERRLLFVAMTRATELLFLSYPKKFDGKGTEPSRFLLELIGML